MPSRGSYKKSYKRRLTKKFGAPKKVIPAVRTLQAALRRLNVRTKALNSMIETKEAQWKTYPNTSLPHNNIYICKTDVLQLSELNPFYITNGTQDVSQQNGGQRIGDQINVKGMCITAFIENALERPKVFYRIMLVRCARGDVPTKNTLFKGDSDNKMIDVVNTERYTIVAQRRFTVSCSNITANGVTSTGVPYQNPVNLAGIGTKIVKFWIPGRKFGKYGKIQYENGNNGQLKFYDYRVVLMAYDWYGTPETNNVGKINELYTKVYFKDA